MATRTPRNGPISDELLDRLLAGRDPAEAFRSGELINDLKKAVAERALDAEMDVPPPAALRLQRRHHLPVRQVVQHELQPPQLRQPFDIVPGKAYCGPSPWRLPPWSGCGCPATIILPHGPLSQVRNPRSAPPRYARP